ncbi:MAG: type II toxin-antitoxin system RelE/ParE family toxin [Oscillospiraceae bacterium]|nr:type II toxin-antitoxin system RelE/ParE family toxin [Oscillospiraceae bacterium]
MDEELLRYNVIISQNVYEMLGRHAAFIAKVNVNAAKKLAVSFKSAAESLKQMPERFPIYKGDYMPNNKYRYVLFEKWFILLFKIEGTDVYIDSVIDARRDDKRYWLR